MLTGSVRVAEDCRRSDFLTTQEAGGEGCKLCKKQLSLDVDHQSSRSEFVVVVVPPTLQPENSDSRAHFWWPCWPGTQWNSTSALSGDAPLASRPGQMKTDAGLGAISCSVEPTSTTAPLRSCHENMFLPFGTWTQIWGACSLIWYVVSPSLRSLCCSVYCSSSHWLWKHLFGIFLYNYSQFIDFYPLSVFLVIGEFSDNFASLWRSILLQSVPHVLNPNFLNANPVHPNPLCLCRPEGAN